MRHAAVRSCPILRSIRAALFPLILATIGSTPLPGQDPRDDAGLARAFPAETALFLESDDAAALIRGGYAALRERLLASEGWRAFLGSPEGNEFQKGIAFLTLTTGRDPLALIDALLGDAAAFGLVPGEGSAVPLLVLRPRDPAFARALLEVLDRFEKRPMRRFELGGAPATEVGGAIRLWEGDLLVVGGAESAVTAAIARLRGERGEDDLAHAPRHRAAAARPGARAPLRLSIDLAALRARGAAGGLGAPPADALASIVFGGYGQMLGAAERIELGVRFEGRTLVLRGTAIGVPASSAHRCYLPAGARTVVATPPGALATLGLGRDLGAWWESRLALVGEGAHAALAKFSTDIGNAFGGRDFGEEVLARMRDSVQLFVLPPPAAPAGTASPDPLLPSFALAVPLAGDGIAPFQVLFQTLITFVNFDRMQRDLPPWIFGAETAQGTAITVASPASSMGGGTPGIEANFRPSMAVRDGTLYLASEPSAVRALLAAGLATPPIGSIPNGSFEIRAAPLGAALAANRAALVANRVLEGRTVAEAEVDIAVALSLLSLLERFAVSVDAAEGALGLEAVLELAPPLPPSADAAPPRERF